MGMQPNYQNQVNNALANANQAVQGAQKRVILSIVGSVVLVIVIVVLRFVLYSLRYR